MQDRDLNEYSPSRSSTSKHVSCSHQLCALGSTCKNNKLPCPYSVDYATENTSSSGLLVEDILHLASGNAGASNKYLRAPVIFGCGRKQSGSYLDGVAPDGLMGLGMSDISVPSFLAKAGFVGNSFSLCFNEDDSGRIYFGDLGLATQQTTPFLPLDGKYVTYIIGVESWCIGISCLDQTRFNTLVDSGSSFTYLPREAYRKVVEEFDRRVNATKATFENLPWEYCYKSSSSQWPRIPSIMLKFASNNSLVIREPVYVINGSQGVVGFCLAIESIDQDLGVIGQNYMKGYRMVFDRDNLKLGWSRSNCEVLSDDERLPLANSSSLNPLPTTQQQRTPGGHAVAPAVAGRTPSNSSGASLWLSCSFWLRLPKLLAPLLLLFHKLVCTF